MSGIPIYWCEFSRKWAATEHGYEVYLLLNPKGEHAEDAWWYARLGHSFECHDYEGSKEESADLVKSYTNFLCRFPHGTHSAKAKELLLFYQSELDSFNNH
jgi:hypothetical protein